jgi:hypothetical protein
MEKVTYLIDTEGVEHAIIDQSNGEYTSMTKATYDAQQAITLASELSNPSTPQAGA